MWRSIVALFKPKGDLFRRGYVLESIIPQRREAFDKRQALAEEWVGEFDVRIERLGQTVLATHGQNHFERWKAHIRTAAPRRISVHAADAVAPTNVEHVAALGVAAGILAAGGMAEDEIVRWKAAMGEALAGSSEKQWSDVMSMTMVFSEKNLLDEQASAEWFGLLMRSLHLDTVFAPCFYRGARVNLVAILINSMQQDWEQLAECLDLMQQCSDQRTLLANQFIVNTERNDAREVARVAQEARALNWATLDSIGELFGFDERYETVWSSYVESAYPEIIFDSERVVEEFVTARKMHADNVDELINIMEMRQEYDEEYRKLTRELVEMSRTAMWFPYEREVGYLPSGSGIDNTRYRAVFNERRELSARVRRQVNRNIE